MNTMVSLIIMVGARPVGALYGWWGIVMLLVGAYIALTNGGLVHFSGGIHRPVWTDWSETQGFGTTSWGLSAGTVACEERICKKCGSTQRKNWRRID